MKIDVKDPPRSYTVGNTARFSMHDCATIGLAPDEQVTFVTESGAEYDVARKTWGFYATPSLNGRLQSFGLRTALIRNRLTNRYFILLVEQGHQEEFEAYLKQEECSVVVWLDDDEVLRTLSAKHG